MPRELLRRQRRIGRTDVLRGVHMWWGPILSSGEQQFRRHRVQSRTLLHWRHRRTAVMRHTRLLLCGWLGIRDVHIVPAWLVWRHRIADVVDVLRSVFLRAR